MNSYPIETHAGRRSATQKLLGLCAVCLAALCMPLSFTCSAVALPDIARELGGNPIALSWITNAFMLCFGGFLLVAGALADRIGRKKVFLTGVVVFTVASFGLWHASSIAAVDLLRALQGLAAAAALSGGGAALAQDFEGPAMTRAFSCLGTSFGVGLAFGPIFAGFLIQQSGWRSVFVGTMVIGMVAFVLAALCMRDSRDRDAAGLDWPGALSFTAALALLTYAVLRAPDSGWGSASVLGLLAASIVLFGAFAVIENTVRNPLLDLSLFRYRRFIGVQFLAAAPAYSYVVLLVLLPLRLISIEGYGSLEAGQIMFAISAPLLVLPMVAGLLTRWFSAGAICGVGLLIAAAGLLWLAQCPPGHSAAAIVPAMFTIGAGVGLPWGLMDGLAVSVVPKERAGMATGIFNTTRVAGESIALAVVAALLAAFAETGLHDTLAGAAQAPARQALSEAAHWLSLGGVGEVTRLLTGLDHAEMLASFGRAFSSLVYVLAAITLLSAVMIFSFLTRVRPTVATRLGGVDSLAE
jgi:MFS family permease